MKFFRRKFLKKSILGIISFFTFGGIVLSAFKNSNLSKKKLILSYAVKDRHWVGNGFFVHGLLRPSEEINKLISPFILMDYASPKVFSQTKERRGVGEHPHRGFETVTLAYQGEIEHRDSAGGGGVIKSGDVQWMTAGSGIVHDEFHSNNFSIEGGTFEMVQIWVNLPKRDKMTKPKYQTIEKSTIPKVKLGESSELRVIAGDFEGSRGPASTFTPINLYDLASDSKDQISLSLKDGSNTILLIMNGEVVFDKKSYSEQNLLIFDQSGDQLELEVSKNFKGLILNGDPINEPVVAHGPFVMNTREEIVEAINDFQNGLMGKL